MARLKARPVRAPGNRIVEEELEPIEITNFLTGLVTDIDPARIPAEALSSMLNMCYRRGMLFRRNGLALHSTKPEASKILNIIAITQAASGTTFLRFTKDKIYRYTAAGWVEVTPSLIAANSGTDYEYFSFAVGDDRAFFANGVDEIRELTLGTNTYVAVGNAPIVKYITTAFGRLIGVIHNEVYWSGDGDYDEWDPLVDISAGSATMSESPSDLDDDTTGVFSQGNNLIVTRQRSIWYGTAQPSATAPFKFKSVIPGIGADAPRTIKLTKHGLVWFNLDNLSIYVWNFGAFDPDSGDLAGPIRSHLSEATISTVEDIWATFSWSRNEYTLFFYSDITGRTRAWTYNFTYKNWSYAEYSRVVEAQDISLNGAATEIDSLSGDIDTLSGTIDALGGVVSGASKFFGDLNGEIYTQKNYDGLASQVLDITLDDNGSAFDCEVESKIFEFVTNDMFLNEHSVIVIPYSIGTVSLSYSKDDGATFSTPKEITFESADLNKAFRIKKRKAIKTERFMWKVESADCMFALSAASIKAIQVNEGR